MMWLPRLALFLTSLSLLGFGLLMLFAPDVGFASLVSSPLAPAFKTELRSFYGGLELALALFVGRGLWQASKERMASALEIGGISFGAVALCRAYGLLVDGDFNAWHQVALPVEIGLTLLCATAWWRLRRQVV